MSRTERPRKTKIGTEEAHVTCDSDTTFKVKRSKVKVTRPVYSPRCLRTDSCSGQRGNVLSVGNCCYVALPSAGAAVGSAAFGAHTERRGAGAYRVATRTACYILLLFLLFVIFTFCIFASYSFLSAVVLFYGGQFNGLLWPFW